MGSDAWRVYIGGGRWWYHPEYKVVQSNRHHGTDMSTVVVPSTKQVETTFLRQKRMFNLRVPRFDHDELTPNLFKGVVAVLYDGLHGTCGKGSASAPHI